MMRVKFVKSRSQISRDLQNPEGCGGKFQEIWEHWNFPKVGTDVERTVPSTHHPPVREPSCAGWLSREHYTNNSASPKAQSCVLGESSHDCVMPRPGACQIFFSISYRIPLANATMMCLGSGIAGAVHL